jgi:hypothetical protein
MADEFELGFSELGGIPEIEASGTDGGGTDGGTDPGDVGTGGGTTPAPNVLFRLSGGGDLSGISVRLYDAATGDRLLSLVTDSAGVASGVLQSTAAFNVLFSDPTHQHAPIARGPYQLSAT